MSVGRFLQQGAAGNAGAGATYVDDVFSTYLYEGTGYGRGVTNGLLLGDGLSGGEATYFKWDTKFSDSSTPTTGASSYTVSMYVKADTDDISARPFMISQQTTFTLTPSRIDFNSNRQDGNGLAIAWFFTHTGKFIPGRWNHILFSVSNNGSKYMYINDQQAAVFAGSVYSTSPMYGIAPTVGGNNTSSPTASNSFDGSLARIYVKKEYVDLSVESNRRIFVNADLTPVSHSSLEARNPELYMPLGSNYTENLGTESYSFSVSGDGTPELTDGVDSTVSGEGGMLWIKNRDAAVNHQIHDTERGASVGLNTNNTNAQYTDANAITSFNPDGFSMNNNYNSHNQSGVDFVSWTFRKQPGFFDVVTYTGNGSARTISHNLGSVPGMIIVKRIDSSGDWQVYHRSNTASPETDYLVLNSPAATADSNTRWNDTAPTSSVFSVGTEATVNASSATYVAYLFAHDAQEFGTDSDESIIKCGTFTGNPVTVDLGWEPQWILLKKTTGSNDWIMYDTMRGWQTDGTGSYLQANTSNAEVFTSLEITKINSTGVEFVSYGGTWVYVAIRRPHKPAEEFAATDLFHVETMINSSSSEDRTVDTGFNVDSLLFKVYDTSSQWFWTDRLRGTGNLLRTDSTAAEDRNTNNWVKWDTNEAISEDLISWNNDRVYYAFRRAPGFFDVVNYTGSSSAQEIPHNLGVAPELIIQKCKTQSSYPWNSWYTGLTNSQYINLNTTAAVSSSSNLWGTNATVATDSVFRTGSGNTGVDGSTSDTHVAYLFATVPGISKVGTFNRPSQVAQDIDCGFENGARFVLIKRTNTTGNWVLWDSDRGIVAGSESYLVINSSAAQVNNQDYIDPLSSGFTLTSGIATGDWVFLAIA